MQPLSRRLFLLSNLAPLALGGVGTAGAATPSVTRDGVSDASRPAGVSPVACVVEYDVAPGDPERFRRFAGSLSSVVRQAGGEVLGLYAPHDEGGGLAAALFGFGNLEDYARCRARLEGEAPAFGALGHGVAAGFIRAERWSFHTQLTAPAAHAA